MIRPQKRLLQRLHHRRHLAFPLSMIRPQKRPLQRLHHRRHLAFRSSMMRPQNPPPQRRPHRRRLVFRSSMIRLQNPPLQSRSQIPSMMISHPRRRRALPLNHRLLRGRAALSGRVRRRMTPRPSPQNSKSRPRVRRRFRLKSSLSPLSPQFLLQACRIWGNSSVGMSCFV